MPERTETIDSVLAEAVRYEKLADDAEMLRVSIRLRTTIRWRHTVKRLVLAPLNREEVVPEGQVDAMYRALAIVRDEAAANALRVRARLRLDPNPDGSGSGRG